MRFRHEEELEAMISLRACPNKRLVKSKAARKKNNLYMMSTA